MSIPTNKRLLHQWLATLKNNTRTELRLPPVLLKATQALADKKDWSMSYAQRYLIARGLAVEK